MHAIHSDQLDLKIQKTWYQILKCNLLRANDEGMHQIKNGKIYYIFDSNLHQGRCRNFCWLLSMPLLNLCPESYTLEDPAYHKQIYTYMCACICVHTTVSVWGISGCLYYLRPSSESWHRTICKPKHSLLWVTLFKPQGNTSSPPFCSPSTRAKMQL